MVWFLCVHGPLLDPWLSWAFVWTRFMHEDPIGSWSYPFLGNDSAVNTDGYLAVPLIPLIFLSDWSGSATERAGSVLPPCLSVQINVDMCGWFSWYLYCCSSKRYKCRCHVCTVHDIIMGERGCAVLHGLRPWPRPVHLAASLTLVPDSIMSTLIHTKRRILIYDEMRTK